MTDYLSDERTSSFIRGWHRNIRSKHHFYQFQLKHLKSSISSRTVTIIGFCPDGRSDLGRGTWSQRQEWFDLHRCHEPSDRRLA